MTRVLYVIKKPELSFSMSDLSNTPLAAWENYFAFKGHMTRNDFRGDIRRAISMDGVRVCIVQVIETGALADEGF